MSDDLLKDLLHAASRTDIAESDLAALKSRITTLNVVNTRDFSGYPLPDDVKLLDACHRIAKLLATTPGTIRAKNTPDGTTRYTVTVLLERTMHIPSNLT